MDDTSDAMWYRPMAYFTSYAGLKDTVVAGGVPSKFYAIWLLVISLLNLLLYQYVLQWSIVVNIAFVGIESGVVLVFFIWNCVNWAWSDVAVHRLYNDVGQEGKTFSGRELIDSRYSRANAAVDLGIFATAAVFVIFEWTIVGCLVWGNAGNHWYNGVTSTINYPLSNTAHFPTLTGAIIEQVNYRSNLHLFVFLKDLVLLGFLLMTHELAVELHEYRVRIMKKSGMSRENPMGAGLSNKTAEMNIRGQQSSTALLGSRV